MYNFKDYKEMGRTQQREYLSELWEAMRATTSLEEISRFVWEIDKLQKWILEENESTWLCHDCNDELKAGAAYASIARSADLCKDCFLKEYFPK